MMYFFFNRWWPDNCTCPGGNSSWENVSHHYSKKIDNTYCHGQKDPCKEKGGK